MKIRIKVLPGRFQWPFILGLKILPLQWFLSYKVMHKILRKRPFRVGQIYFPGEELDHMPNVSAKKIKTYASAAETSDQSIKFHWKKEAWFGLRDS